MITASCSEHMLGLIPAAKLATPTWREMVFLISKSLQSTSIEENLNPANRISGTVQVMSKSSPVLNPRPNRHQSKIEPLTPRRETRRGHVSNSTLCAVIPHQRYKAASRVVESYCLGSLIRNTLCNMLIGYARVSTNEQDTAAQVGALKSAGCERIFREKASGGRWDRPELHRLLDQLRKADVLVVWKLDRLSRSLRDVLTIMEHIAKAKAGFRNLSVLNGGFRADVVSTRSSSMDLLFSLNSVSKPRILSVRTVYVLRSPKHHKPSCFRQGARSLA
jgi:Resolvase, N terminal domain